jgi:polysaccharide deacetylase family protein (PEP-CTERM system associated)
MPRINALSIDVEDYFQVSAFEKIIDRNHWDSLEHRIEKNLNKTLAVFANQNVKATFFTLGWVAERYPQLIKSIVEAGHELASHGYGHQRVTDLTPDQFREDVTKARKILEDISGLKIRGYRAPSYSIGKDNLWALEILAETGHQYSSSIYPIQHDHYGFPEAPRFCFRDEKTGLIEIPISTVKVLNKLRPAGGGGFFRFYPYTVTRWAINRVNKEGESTVFYLHPWELDPAQPRQQGISTKTRFRHYLNLDKTEGRLIRLLKDFNWGTMNDVFLKDKTLGSYKLT